MHQRPLLLTSVTHLPSIWSTVDRKSDSFRAGHLGRTGTVPALAQPFSPWPAPRPRGLANLDSPARGGSEREHAADQGPPGQRADDSVDGDAERLLEAAHRRRGLGAE